MENTKKDNVIEIPITYRSVPFVYVKMNNINDRYRLSGNFKYLNEQYKLKLKMIRNFREIYLDIKEKDSQLKDTPWLRIINNSTIDIKFPEEWQTWQLGKNDNVLDIKRIIIKNNDSLNTIIVLKRSFKGSFNDSIFFSSDKYFSMNEFLRSL